MKVVAQNARTLGHLSDSSSLHEAVDVHGEDVAQLLESLRLMRLIRRAEEVIADNVRSGVIRCPCHLAIGQEACAVGVARALGPHDRVFGAHRSHGHFLALGGSVYRLFAEVLGKDSGVSRGMGGSMHLRDAAIGLMGTVPIVGATIPIAVGAGWAARREGRGGIGVSFFGDGATEEGSFHESLNLAIVLPAPTLFVCENNFFSSHLHIDLRQPFQSTSRFAEANGIEWRRVDGNDVAATARAARELTDRMRRDGKPGFLELITYRWRGHVGWRDDEDVGVARGVDLPAWRKRDPIGRLEKGLRDGGNADDVMLRAIEEAVNTLVRESWERAMQDPYPANSALLERVYSTSRRP